MSQHHQHHPERPSPEAVIDRHSRLFPSTCGTWADDQNAYEHFKADVIHLAGIDCAADKRGLYRLEQAIHDFRERTGL